MLRLRPSLWMLLVTLTTAWSGCLTEVGGDEETGDRDTSSKKNRLDILFVVDKSGSMADDLDQVSNTPSLLAQQLHRTSKDVKIGWITTALASLGKVQRSARFITSDESVAEITSWLHQMLQTQDASGSGLSQENGFDVISLFLGDHSATFRREHAPLEIVVLTDEDDGSSLTADEFFDYLDKKDICVHGLLGNPAKRWERIITRTNGQQMKLNAGNLGALFERLLFPSSV
jgi:hypothetical protein